MLDIFRQSLQGFMLRKFVISTTKLSFTADVFLNEAISPVRLTGSIRALKIPSTPYPVLPPSGRLSVKATGIESGNVRGLSRVKEFELRGFDGVMGFFPLEHPFPQKPIMVK
jgi:hypothetical protein